MGSFSHAVDIGVYVYPVCCYRHRLSFCFHPVLIAFLDESGAKLMGSCSTAKFQSVLLVRMTKAACFGQFTQWSGGIPGIADILVSLCRHTMAGHHVWPVLWLQSLK